MKELLKSDRIKIIPVIEKSEINEFLKIKGIDVIGLYVTQTEKGPIVNIGYPSIASYNPILGNMYGFEKNHGMYFLTGKFPESNERPIYVVSISNSLTIDSYAQTNASIVGEYDLLDVLDGILQQELEAKKEAEKKAK